MNYRLAFAFSYEHFENALICIIYIRSSTRLRLILNFPIFREKGALLELFNMNFLIKCYSLYFKTYFMQIGHCYLYWQQFKTTDSNIFFLSSMFSSQIAWPIKRKTVYTLVLFHIFIHFLVACENRIS